jgi:hypothetical protein
MKDLIIGCSTNYKWDTLKYWVNSINQSGFTGDKVLILMNCDRETKERILDAGFNIRASFEDEHGNLKHPDSPFPVHVERFIHIYKYLVENPDYRYAITTDVKDVVFQKNPIPRMEYELQNHNLMFASESIKYKDEPWGNQNLMETYGPYLHEKFKNNEIYNVGVLAGRAYAIRDLAVNIFTNCIGKAIPICDQSTFNFMISQHPYLHTSRYMKSEDGWACQLGTTADPSKIEQFRPHLLEAEPRIHEHRITTSKFEEFNIVHQYDRVPEWRKVIEARYG